MESLLSLNLKASGIAFAGIALGFAIWYLFFRKRFKHVKSDSPEQVIESKAEIVAIETPPQLASPEGKYPAIIIPTSGAWYFGKIPEPTGHIWVCDTTMPHTGDHYLVKATADVGVFVPYDPRTDRILTNASPEDAFRKTQNWEPDIPYRDEPDFLEKLPKILAYVLVFSAVLAVLIYIGK